MIEEIFELSGNNLKLCALYDHFGNMRLAEPYMIYHSATNKRLLHFFQIDGFVKVVRIWVGRTHVSIHFQRQLFWRKILFRELNIIHLISKCFQSFILQYLHMMVEKRV